MNKKEKNQLIDVLIIDDVQFFNRAEKSQDAFFAIFNHFFADVSKEFDHFSWSKSV